MKWCVGMESLRPLPSPLNPWVSQLLTRQWIHWGSLRSDEVCKVVKSVLDRSVVLPDLRAGTPIRIIQRNRYRRSVSHNRDPIAHFPDFLEISASLNASFVAALFEEKELFSTRSLATKWKRCSCKAQTFSRAESSWAYIKRLRVLLGEEGGRTRLPSKNVNSSLQLASTQRSRLADSLADR